VLTYVVGLSVWLGLGMAVLARDVLRMVSTPAYLDAARVVPLSALAYVCWGASLVFDGSIYISKRTAYKPILLAAAAVVSVALNLLLIPRLGMMGAAWAGLGSYAVFAALTWAVGNRLYAIPYEFVRSAKVAGLALGLYGLSTLVTLGGVPGMLARAGIALSLPLLLAAVRFYEPEELGWLRRLRRRRLPVATQELS
jgi:O-antigen/teichoic acid export membrane protein